jgi:hypothetical protein
MATLYASPNPTPANDVVRNRIPASAAAGDVRYCESVYTFTGAEVTADNIVIAELPVGATVLPELSAVAQEASMGGGTLAVPKIGDSTDDDRYSATSITVHASNAGVTAVTPNVGASVIPRFVITATTREVLANFTFATIPTTGKKILFRLAYKLGH